MLQAFWECLREGAGEWRFDGKVKRGNGGVCGRGRLGAQAAGGAGGDASSGVSQPRGGVEAQWVVRVDI